MKTRVVSWIVVFLMTMLHGAIANAAAMPSEFLDAASRGRLIALQTWSPSLDSDVSLNCAIVQSPKEQTQSTLVCYNGSKRILSATSDEATLSMFVMGESGNLMTLWEAGDGTYILRVFSYSDGTIKKTLEGSSKLMPEFVYASSPPGSLVVDEKQLVPKGYWSERIIIGKMDWVHDAKGGADRYLPITADVFTWDGKRYEARKEVKWTERLK